MEVQGGGAASGKRAAVGKVRKGGFQAALGGSQRATHKRITDNLRLGQIRKGVQVPGK